MKHKVIEGDDILDIIEKYHIGVNEIILCSPFLSLDTITSIFNILQKKSQINLKLITKYDPIDILMNASDVNAFRFVFEKNKYQKWNIEVFVLNNLHAKVIVLGTKAAIIGSSNLTYSGFHRNQEIGIGIFHEDSKIRTIRKRLDKFIANGNLLTEQDFQLYCENDLPRYEKRVATIKKLLSDIRRERDVGLQSFVPGNKKTTDIDYFTGVLSILHFISNGRRSKKDCKNWLNKRSTREGKEINEQRLTFLQNLGLLVITSYSVTLSSFGREILKQNSTDLFYNRLVVRHPEFEQLSVLFEQKTKIHPHELDTKKGLYGGEEYWAARLRWLESLGKVKAVIQDRYKYYEKF